MPEIDTDLFQLLSLVLLGLVLLIGLAILAALGKLRKSLETAAERNRPPAAAESPQYFEPPSGGLTAAAAEMPGSAGAEPEPQAESATPAEEPAAAAGVVSAEQLAPEPEVARATPEPVAEAPVKAEPEPVNETAQPVAAAAPAEASGAAGADEAAVAGAATQAEEPEEQPFERGGRWWFRRGDELLVYDDASGQWQQAPPEAAPSGPARQGVPTTFGDVVRAETDTAEISVEEEAEQGGSFWKCPACGAVNGSTATSCRMCFAARP